MLGRWVGYRRWGPMQDKLAEVAAQRPKNVPELRSMLGSVNWLRRHVGEISTAFELSSLLRENRLWHCDERMEDAWQRLEKAVQDVTAVRTAIPNRPLLLISDPSDEGGGGALLQLQKEDDEGEEVFHFLGHWASGY